MAIHTFSNPVRLSLIGLASLAIAVGVGRFAFTPLLPMMQSDGLLSVADGGLLAGVHFLGYLLGAAFALKVPGSPRRLLALSLYGISVATLAMGLTDNIALWSLLRWFNGVLSAWALVLVSNYLVRALAEINRADCQGWVFAGVGTGIAIVGLFSLVFMTGDISSDHAWIITGLLSLIAAAIVIRHIGSELPCIRIDRASRTECRTPLNWTLILAYGAAGVGYIIPATYLPLMAREIVPSPLVFGWSWPVFGAAALLSTLLTAKLQRRLSNRLLWAICQSVMALGLLLPLVATHISMIVVAGLCVGGTFMVITMVGMKEAHRIAGAGDAARHIAILTAAFASGQIAGPLIGSVVFRVTGVFDLALAAAAILLVLTSLSLVITHKSEASVLIKQ